MVEQWNGGVGGMVEQWDGGIVEWGGWRYGGILGWWIIWIVDNWDCGIVGWWISGIGGMVERWNGGSVVWWDSGMGVGCMEKQLSKRHIRDRTLPSVKKRSGKQ